jgi:hypothetical protein
VFEDQLLPTIRKLPTRRDPMGPMSRAILEPGATP